MAKRNRNKFRTCEQCGKSKRMRASQPYCSRECAWDARRIPIAERFWSKVNKDGPNSDYRPDLGPCWLWLAGCSDSGYANFKVGEKDLKAHRWSYIEANGPVPEGLDLDHLCRVLSCVNTSHLEAVTPTVNVLRGIGPTAKNAAKTHCKYGHPFDEENTMKRPLGRRGCITCNRERARRHRKAATSAA